MVSSKLTPDFSGFAIGIHLSIFSFFLTPLTLLIFAYSFKIINATMPDITDMLIHSTKAQPVPKWMKIPTGTSFVKFRNFVSYPSLPPGTISACHKSSYRFE
jgi:hypothetical protein